MIVSQCCTNLQKTQNQLNSFTKSKNSNKNLNPKIKQNAMILYQRIDLAFRMYQQQSRQVQKKNLNSSSLKYISDYIINNSKKLIQEAHRLTIVDTISNGSTNFNSKRDRFNRVKYYENQLECDWDQLNQLNQKKFKQNQNNLNSNTNQNAISIKDRNLKQQAKQHLQKQFLAIRVLAYKMYQQYTQHDHTQINQKILVLKDQQSKLIKEINQIKDQTKQLKKQEKQLQKELNDLKRVNQLISKRYFVSTTEEASSFVNIN